MSIEYHCDNCGAYFEDMEGEYADCPECGDSDCQPTEVAERGKE